ncbi:MAG: 3-methyladenine DNA glycosylase [Candidatus Methanohalarchaeum thermophilum]|uniref:Putative 3-methyladenine DNA glycosylase n=1 Tax=Methanohalarchaeum thermophilum TaxID=1903181 RepID=A0A1Q6DU07_METT1|nr:MAG: 3-methyladenine DNA glycosylase [Candidatus Methanohalarchaeum thermophilum]
MLSRAFYTRDAVEVAKNLLGKILVHKTSNSVLKGKIVETEAYCGEEDSACHASVGKTNRTEVMYRKGGIAYIYLIYGIHTMLNFVTNVEGIPEAVLIRAVEPIEGLDKMKKNRGKQNNLTNGPGKVTEAFNIDMNLNGLDITKENRLWTKNGYKADEIVKDQRIGVEDNSHLRFYIENNEYVSRK